VPAEARPCAIGDHDRDGIPDLMVKFKRSDVIALLPTGEKVPIHVTGKVGSTIFDGVDIIRVINCQ
jgi:large repetitive protein